MEDQDSADHHPHPQGMVDQDMVGNHHRHQECMDHRRQECMMEMEITDDQEGEEHIMHAKHVAQYANFIKHA